MNFQKRSRKRIPAAIATGLFLLCTQGCKDGPFYEMKKINPFIQEQWRKDRERRTVFTQRIDEFDLLRDSIKSYPTDEQARNLQMLRGIAEIETSPEIRRRIAQVYGQVLDQDLALEGLSHLSRDKEPKVRLEVAKVLGQSSSEISGQTLLAMAAADKDENVRNRATESLGAVQTDEARAFLKRQLEAKQPATQFSAYLALEQHTGKKFGGDVTKMRQYMAGEAVEEVEASFFASTLDYFNWTR